MVSVCGTYYIILRDISEINFGAKNGPKIGHLSANNGNYLQLYTTKHFQQQLELVVVTYGL